MNTTDSSRGYYTQPQRGYPMPPPQIPKQRIPFFTWLMILFAGLVLLGVVWSFVDVANEPRPVLDVPEGEPAPVTPP